MKIYLAARYRRREEMLGYAEELRQMGHTVNCRWLDGDHSVADAQLTEGTLGFDEAARFAVEDCEDLWASEVVISFPEPPRLGDSRGGRHVEFGIALGLGKECIVVGYRENVFHYLPQVIFCPTWLDAKRVLGSARP